MRFFWLLLCFPVLVSSEVPDWMKNQIEKDLSFFKNKTISYSELNNFYEKKASQLVLVKYSIQDNKISVNKDYVNVKKYKERIERYFDVLTQLCKTVGLPDTVLLISMNDGLNAKEELPFFAMCKMDSDRIILIPDYEALGARYQVLKDKNIDVFRVDFPWSKKIPKLVWRGSTAQRFSTITEEKIARFSRIKLCELSNQHPELIDAKFTVFAQGADQLLSLRKFEGDRMGFEQQMDYRYHILIDGNVAPYTKSGWKLFTNSLIFKPESKWIQWYFGCLQPYVHYIPVKEDLSDLIDKINWALENDEEAEKIATRTREFALNHFSPAAHLSYLYEAIIRYHQLNFVP